MKRYSVASLAEWDLKGIARQAMRMWGSSLGNQYLQSILTCLQLIADDPSLGHACDSVLPGLRSLECGEHFVSYMSSPEGVLIARVLHRKMLPAAAPSPQ